ncbi:hypothetical protein N7468_007024 [Penicillium chermesinum]|uniref:Nucleic acid-binding, OB-fold protein n=1 Tax=Penicillium chermesinum TaxID=63820 RepID=A0A9W9TKD4_9EURO|nr:uncharacterized protein N7468_007024 [Penicillium chermesinum]KAJ5225799.1 hypothetical protein N7468_007024 [Penicillium chermesinum]KAJ6160991.1 hypothetical protein N7470_004387 [Penicillium chermesinum]
MSKTIFLMGAPLPSSLDWDHDELLDTPVAPFQETDSSHFVPLSLGQSTKKWRVLQPLPHEEVDDPNMFFYYGPRDPNFLTTHQLADNDTQSTNHDETVLSQFYDHSFAVHETSAISASFEDGEQTQYSGSVLGSHEGNDSSQRLTPDTPPFRIFGRLSNLQDVPTASYLESVIPQTMTVNLVVGVIAIHPSRRVVTRWKQELEIVELVVGDETRAGFSVNFWLSPLKADAKTSQIDRLGGSLTMLRPRDIVLLRAVGLSSFREQVYGQSLRGGMTQVDLLHRPANVTDAGGFYKTIPPSNDDLPQKVRKVREWILRFVGTDGAGGGLSGMSETQPQRLPPDTQE